MLLLIQLAKAVLHSKLLIFTNHVMSDRGFPVLYHIDEHSNQVYHHKEEDEAQYFLQHADLRLELIFGEVLFDKVIGELPLDPIS